MGKPFKCGRCENLLTFCSCAHPIILDVHNDLVVSGKRTGHYSKPPEIIWEDAATTIRELNHD